MKAKILDFNKKRRETIEKKRRSFERLLFENLLGAYFVVDNAGSLLSVELIDISRDGCQFKIPHIADREKKLAKNTEITLRIYFTPESYIPAVAKIKYHNLVHNSDSSFVSYGCQFDQNMPAFAALQNFIDFLYSFAEHSIQEKQKHSISFL